MSATNNTTNTNTSQPNQRLQQLKGQMGSISNGTVATSFTNDVCPQAPEDPLFGLMAAYRRDTDKNKVDLGIGAYRDDNAKPWVLPVVKKVRAAVDEVVSCLVALHVFLAPQP